MRGRPVTVDHAAIYRAYQSMERYGAIIALAKRFRCSQSTIVKSVKRSKLKANAYRAEWPDRIKAEQTQRTIDNKVMPW
jgi:hypothetical protein